MRITLVNQFYAPDISPTAQLAASVAEHRAAQGDAVTVITGKAGYLEDLVPSAPAHQGPLLEVRRVWTPDLGKSTVARRLLGYTSYSSLGLVRLLTLKRQDVVIAMTTPPLIVVAAVLHKVLHRRTRVVLWSMDCYPDAAERFGELKDGGVASRALRAVNRWAFRRVDEVVALDGAMVELLQQYVTTPTPAFHVVPNWERAALFPEPTATTIEPWAGYDDLPADRPVVVYLGNTGVGHRFDTALDAAEHLADDVTFLFVGGGSRWDELESEVARRHLGNVVMHGYVPKEDTPAVMAGAAAALITLDDRSLGVMSPSKLHANLAAGLPVVYVGPAGSNVDEAIERFACGASTRTGDVAGLVAAVRSVIGDPAGRGRAREAFESAYADTATLPLMDAVIG